ncbi:DPY30 domain containing 2 isoform X2 [Electrophorus electricus]|uniref:DPY30 domain containing 2 isoform X2 n=1 Tax=Electrophorus electricus TaxID=8005 RepID=UPI0015D0B224|nr:DPY30 domain containing 2 isoform X2 [Electrophorus electricus]
MDSAYLQQKLGRCLVEGLAATVERRPPDPVEFLALWIYKHRENLEHAEKRAVYEKQLAEALESAREEALHQRLLRDEEDRVRAAQEPREEAVSTPPPTPLKERPQKLNTPVLEAVLEEEHKVNTATPKPVAPAQDTVPDTQDEEGKGAELQTEGGAGLPPTGARPSEEDSAGPAVAEDTAGLERSADMERSPPIAGTGEVQKPDDLERRPTEKVMYRLVTSKGRSAWQATADRVCLNFEAIRECNRHSWQARPDVLRHARHAAGTAGRLGPMS